MISSFPYGHGSSIVITGLLKDSISKKQPPDLALLDLPDRHFVVIDSAGQYSVCCVSVIDLDPKRFDRIPFYLTEDRAVSSSYGERASL